MLIELLLLMLEQCSSFWASLRATLATKCENCIACVHPIEQRSRGGQLCCEMRWIEEWPTTARLWPGGFHTPENVLKDVFLAHEPDNTKKTKIGTDMHAIVASQIPISPDVLDSIYMFVPPMAAPPCAAQQWVLHPPQTTNAPPHPNWVRKDAEKMRCQWSSRGKI